MNKVELRQRANLAKVPWLMSDENGTKTQVHHVHLMNTVLMEHPSISSLDLEIYTAQKCWLDASWVVIDTA